MQTTTFTQSLLDRYIEEEQQQQARQQSLAALSVHLDANDLAMLNMISKRFNKNRIEVAEELLASALVDVFARFEAGERKILARDADEAARSIASDIAEDNGLKEINIKTGAWASQDKDISKLERKLARLQAEQEQDLEEVEEIEPDAELNTEVRKDNDSELAAREADNDDAETPFAQASSFN